MPTYLVTGGAGFIGSHLVRALLEAGHGVRVLDDLSTGHAAHLDAVREDIAWFEGSIVDRDLVSKAVQGCDFCLHQAALPSVPRSVQDPWTSNRINVEGSLNVLLAARDAGLRRVVYASSSSVYGDAPTMPVFERLPRQPLSPYAVSKAAVEAYAESFTRLYDLELVGLRYFNVFGPRQDPDSPYAAVIPKFIRRLRAGEPPEIYGDGQQARDFTYVDNVVSANLLASELDAPLSGVFNVACGTSITLIETVTALQRTLGTDIAPEFLPPRPGDIQRSWANVEAARDAFGYQPVVEFEEGLRRTVEAIE